MDPAKFEGGTIGNFVREKDSDPLKYGYAKRDGTLSVTPAYRDFAVVGDAYLAFQEDNDMWAIFDIDGNQLTDFKYDAVWRGIWLGKKLIFSSE